MILNKRKAARFIVFPASVLIFLAVGLTISYRSGPRPVVPVPVAGATAERLLAEARASAAARENAPPVYSVHLDTSGANADGARMLARSDEFRGVAEEPKNVMDTLAEMSGGNEPKIPPVHLTGADLRKKVRLTDTVKPLPLNPSVVLHPGDAGSGATMGETTMVSAPVDYQLFKSSGTWAAFADSHKGRFPTADFSREYMLILVSVSDLPSGIFKVAGVKKTAKEVVVLYRVDPLAMAAASGAKEREFYSAAPVPKNLTVKLQQVP